jgi:hypothetical protein
VLDGEYFLWRPRLQSPQAGVLDIAPESWGIFDVVAPKPGMFLNTIAKCRNIDCWNRGTDNVR